MIVIADCGGTKSDWAIAEDGVCLYRMQTGGINPFHQHEADILDRIAQLTTACRHLLSAARTLEVYFYGAGCNAVGIAKMEPLLRRAFSSFQASLQLHVVSDLLGAARALCGTSEGIACILGTGSNSCLYNGEQIVDNTPPLGYVLGDEGSGADLGKHFLHGILKQVFPVALRDEFYAAYHTSYPELIQRIYHEPCANSFMAGIAPFICRHIGEPCIEDMVRNRFRSFFRYNVSRYRRQDLAVGFVGGIACHFSSQLESAARAEGLLVGAVLQAPMQGLLVYHGVADNHDCDNV